MGVKVISYGTPVKTVVGEIEAIVTGVCIRQNNIRYNIAYFKDGIYRDIWVDEIEIKVKIDNTKKAGLVNYDVPENDDEYRVDLLPPADIIEPK